MYLRPFCRCVGLAQLVIIIALAFITAVAHPTNAEDFTGKTVRIMTLPAGGGFDLYSRAIARHIGRHLPGNPSVVVENMGQRKLRESLRLASRDGLVIGNFDPQILRHVLTGGGPDFDVRRLEWIGVPVLSKLVCILTKASGISSIEQWMASSVPIRLGTTRPGNQNSDAPAILKAALGLPIQLVPGHQGTRGIRAAALNGELAGGCWGWESSQEVWREDLESGNATILMQATPKTLPALPKVPFAIDLAKTEDARRLIQVGIHDSSALDKTYFLPPRTPKNLVLTFQKAFADTMIDKEFVADAKKSRLHIDPLSGAQIESIVGGLVNMEATVVAKLRDILK